MSAENSGQHTLDVGLDRPLACIES